MPSLPNRPLSQLRNTPAGQAGREIFTNDWSKLAPRSALRCMPAFVLPIVAGLAIHQPRIGVIAAAGAFSVGFGSFQQLRSSRAAPMAWAAIGIGVCSWIGTLAGLNTITAILAIAFAGAAFAFVSLISSAVSWIALQCAVWLIISTAYPATGIHALTRGLFLIAGGLLQLGFVLLFWKIERRVTPAYGFQVIERRQEEPLSLRSPQVIFAIESAIALVLAAAIYRFLGLSNSYWIPMTAVIILKPERKQTYQRGLQRILGTLVGVTIASVVLMVSPHMPYMLALLTIAFAYAAYILVFVNYGAFATFLTGYVVFILALAGLPTHALIAHRLLCTAIGGALVMFVYGMGSLVQRRLRKAKEREEVEESPLRRAG